MAFVVLDQVGHVDAAGPQSLDDLKPRFVEEEPIDPWGRRFLYRVRGRRYVLASLGSDGEVGGTDDARDWYIEDGRFVTDEDE